MEDKYKFYFGMYICTIVAAVQLFAWHFGHNGQVFALTSLVIGGIAGAIFGIAKRKTS